MCVCVCVCVRARVCVCVHVWVYILFGQLGVDVMEQRLVEGDDDDVQALGSELLREGAPCRSQGSCHQAARRQGNRAMFVWMEA